MAGDNKTYVAHIDGLAAFSSSCGVVCEWIRGNRRSVAGVKASASASASREAAATEAAATEASTATAESATAETAAKAASHTMETAAACKAHRAPSSGESVFAHLEQTALPVVAVELLNRITSVVRAFEDNDSRSLRTAVGAKVNIGADNNSVASWLHKSEPVVLTQKRVKVRIKPQNVATHQLA